MEVISCKNNNYLLKLKRINLRSNGNCGIGPCGNQCR